MDATGTNGAILSNLFGDSGAAKTPSYLPSDTGDYSASSDLTALLNANTLRSLADVYFSCCHKQMYAFFHEETFRQKLENERLPSYILLAFAATSVRFSKEPCFAGRQTDCRDTYAKLGWDDLMQYAFSDTSMMDVSMVQAAAMLGIIDFISTSIPVPLYCGMLTLAQADERGWLGSSLAWPFASRRHSSWAKSTPLSCARMKPRSGVKHFGLSTSLIN